MDEEIIEQNSEQNSVDNGENTALLEQLERLNTNIETMLSSEEASESANSEVEGSYEPSTVDENSSLTSGEFDSYIEFEDETVDHTLYLSSRVKDASLDDIYAIQLSIRNLGLVFGFMLLGFMCFRMIRSCTDRLLNH